MNIGTYYSILKWRGEEPTKLDRSSDKEFGRRIYEQDIALGKTVWVNNMLIDFKYYVLYYDPLLSMLSNINTAECDEIFIVLLFVLNMSSILATLTASIGFSEQSLSNVSYDHDTNQMLSMTLCASVNGLILAIFQLKWRQFETKKNQKLATLIMNQTGVTIIMFTLCATSLGYYFMMNELNFYSWFLTVYALQFIFGYLFEICALYICFIGGWKRDHSMVQLIPHYLKDGSFSNFAFPKCVYYVTYKDYEEWLEHKRKIDESYDESYDEELEQPLLL